MDRKYLCTEYLLLTGILLLALVLRLIGLGEFSYGNDELSAIWRLRHDNLADLLRYGVKEGDMHPAGVQIFMWLWSKIGGTGEFWMRLPFAVSSVIAVFFLYRLGKSLFDPFTGLLAAGILCTLEYSLHLGQQARPYAPGVMLVIMNTYCWSKIVLRHDAQRRHYIFYALTLAATAYVHYYAVLTAAIIAISGIFFLDRREIKWYALSGVSAFLLFLPHIGILNYQLGVGGLEGWLGRPDKGWLQNYLHDTLNGSDILIMTCLTLMAGGLFFNFRYNRSFFPYLMTILWFASVFLFGYFYSIYKDPILHAYPLFFAFPFLILFGSAIVINPDRKLISSAIIVLVTMSTTISTIAERHYYAGQRIGVFKELAEALSEWQNELGKESMTAAVNVNDAYYIHHYLNETSFQDSLSLYQLEGLNDLNRLYDLVSDSKDDHFAFGWSSRSTPVLAYEIIRMHFPHVVDDRRFQNSRITLFNRQARTDTSLFYAEYHFDRPHDFWQHNMETILTDSTGSHVLLNGAKQFSPIFISTVSSIRMSEGRYIAIEADIERDSSGAPFHIVYQIERDGNLIERHEEKSWYGVDVNEVYPSRAGRFNYIYARLHDSYLEPTDVIKVMVWNNGGGRIKVNRIRIRVEQ